MNGSRCLIVGVAYKKNVDNERIAITRDTKTVNEKGVEVDYHDPYFSSLPKTRKRVSR